MPNLINSEKNKIFKTVEQELRTSNLMKNASPFDFKSLKIESKNLIDLLKLESALTPYTSEIIEDQSAKSCTTQKKLSKTGQKPI